MKNLLFYPLHFLFPMKFNHKTQNPAKIPVLIKLKMQFHIIFCLNWIMFINFCFLFNQVLYQNFVI